MKIKSSHPRCNSVAGSLFRIVTFVLSLLLLAASSLPAFATCVGCGTVASWPCPAPGTITQNGGYWYYGDNVQAYTVTYYLGNCTMGQYCYAQSTPGGPYLQTDYDEFPAGCVGCPAALNAYNAVEWPHFELAVTVNGLTATIQTPVAISGYTLYNLDTATIAAATTNTVVANGTFTISNSLPVGNAGAVAVFNQNGRIDAIYAFRSASNGIIPLPYSRSFGDNTNVPMLSTSLAYVGNGVVKGIVQLRNHSVVFSTGTTQVADQYTIPIPSGFSLIANHLDKGSNTLDEVLPGVTNGTQILKYNCDNSYTANTMVAGVWTPAGGTLKPGEGAFIRNFGAPFNLTFTGTPHMPVLPPPLPCGCGTNNLVSRQTTNSPSTFADIMGFPPVEGTTVYKWNGSGYISAQFVDGAWEGDFGGEPLVNLGEAVFINVSSCPAPVITQQPQSQTNVFSSNVTFSVTATGLPSLSYQWRFNITNILAGATNSTYTVVNAQAYDAGTYDVVVSNAGGPVFSQAATLTLRDINVTGLRLICSDGSPLVGCLVTLT